MPRSLSPQGGLHPDVSPLSPLRGRPRRAIPMSPFANSVRSSKASLAPFRTRASQHASPSSRPQECHRDLARKNLGQVAERGTPLLRATSGTRRELVPASNSSKTATLGSSPIVRLHTATPLVSIDSPATEDGRAPYRQARLRHARARPRPSRPPSWFHICNWSDLHFRKLRNEAKASTTSASSPTYPLPPGHDVLRAPPGEGTCSPLSSKWSGKVFVSREVAQASNAATSSDKLEWDEDRRPDAQCPSLPKSATAAFGPLFLSQA